MLFRSGGGGRGGITHNQLTLSHAVQIWGEGGRGGITHNHLTLSHAVQIWGGGGGGGVGGELHIII